MKNLRKIRVLYLSILGVFCFLLGLFLPEQSFAQPSEEWVAPYNGPGVNDDDFARAIAVDDKGNVYVTGESDLFDEYSEDYTTIKYDADGTQLWVRRYNGSTDPGNFDSPHAIAVDKNGNVYVTGESQGTFYSDWATVKYDTNGNEMWVMRYDNGLDDRAFAIALDKKGNVYVTGESDGGAPTFGDIATIKYDTDGNQIWVARYNNDLENRDDLARAIALDKNGNVYVTGRSRKTSSSCGSDPSPCFDYDYVTIKYSEQ
jgi:alpha-tubulin suppressor-like RCC1 family protein